jgi:hypothetical protein
LRCERAYAAESLGRERGVAAATIATAPKIMSLLFGFCSKFSTVETLSQPSPAPLDLLAMNSPIISPNRYRRKTIYNLEFEV